MAVTSLRSEPTGPYIGSNLQATVKRPAKEVLAVKKKDIMNTPGSTRKLRAPVYIRHPYLEEDSILPCAM